jgi:tRNA U38,U39,U40 pseudouridine synthase TruA
MRTTWRLVIEYDGRAFSGFQRQAGPRTVQETLEEALSRFFGRRPRPRPGDQLPR